MPAAATGEQARLVRLGTRSSPLAMYQAHAVAGLVEERLEGVRVQVVPMTTTGDVDRRPLREIGDRGMFAKELEQALLAGEIDIAVHSLKDVRLDETAGLRIVAIPAREDARDALCGELSSLDDLPEGATVATGSVRRSAALRHLRPDIVVSGIRGNVETRLRVAVERGDAACMLAAAGLKRLGLEQHIGCLLPVDECVPEAGQGAIAVQARAGGDPDLDWSRIDDAEAAWAVGVERIVAEALGGGCDVPLGVHVRREGDSVTGYVFMARPDGSGGLRTSAALDRTADTGAAAAVLLASAHAAGARQVLQGEQRA